MPLVDTDVLIWNLRGDQAAARVLDEGAPFSISAVTYMEVVQGVRNGAELRALQRALRFWGAEVLPINQAISARAMFLVEEFSLSHHMQMADALIAASALYLGETLLTANDRHYRHIRDLDIHVFRPA